MCCNNNVTSSCRLGSCAKDLAEMAAAGIARDRDAAAAQLQPLRLALESAQKDASDKVNSFPLSEITQQQWGIR